LMKVVEAIISGESEPVDLENYVHGRVRNRHKEKVTASFTGTINRTQNVKSWIRKRKLNLKHLKTEKINIYKENSIYQHDMLLRN
jgi:acylphosphatase